jgi:WD40 repeat protein
LAIVGDDHYICIYDLDSRRFAKHIIEHTDWVRCARYSPDGVVLATGGNDRNLRVWNASNWNAPPIVHQHSDAVFDLAFSNDSAKIATVGFGDKLRIHESATGRQIVELECAGPDNHSVAFSDDSSLIAAAGRNGEIRVWRSTGDGQYEVVANITGVHRRRIRSIQFTPDNKIVSCGDDQIVCLTDPRNATIAATLPRHDAKLYSVKLLNQDILAAGGSDNIIHIWRFSDAFKLGQLKGHTGTIACLDFCGLRLVSAGYDTQVRVWQLAGNLGPGGRQTQLTDGWNQKILN